MKITTILFDLDGTLINSMDFHFNAWKIAFKKYNIKISKKEYFPLEGMSLNLIAEYFLIKNKKKISKKNINDIVNEKKKNYLLNANKIKVYEGLNKFLKILKKNKYKIGIVTSSHSDQVKKSLNKKFLQNFNVIVSGDMTKKNKPNPDPYLLASKLLKVHANKCLVFENAPLGIQSALRAKMICIAITNTNIKKNLSNANVVVNNYKDIYNNKLIQYYINFNEKI